MKKKIALLLTVLALAAAVAAPAAQAARQPVGSAELIENSAAYDGQTILFEGEAVGDILPRGDYAWVNVSDVDNSALGIYLPAALAKAIRTTGRYGVTGDRVRITGVFHRACAEHGGDMDLHAETLEIVTPGRAQEPAIPAWLPPLAIGAALCAVTLCTAAFLRLRRGGGSC